MSGQQADDSTATYTANGLVQTVTDAENNKTTYAYDGLDRLSQTLYPSATKGAGTSNASDYEQRGYDSNGNVTSFRNRAAETIGFTYDALNRQTLKDLPGSEPDVAYAYDLLGRLTSEATSAQTLSFTYDALGRNFTQVGPHGTVTSAFDIAGRRTRITHPDGFYVDQDHLVTGETSAIRENGATSGVGVLATFAYDDLGRRTSLTRGNGTSTSYSYDGVSRLSSLAQDASGTTYDQTLGFSYSPASQIVQNTRSNDLFAWGGHGSGSTSSTVNGLNQLTVLGGTSTSHDSRGNMTADGLGKTFGYTSENLLTSASGSVSASYDPAMRLYQVAGTATTRFQYDGADAIAEYNASNALQRRYVHGPGTDEPLVWYEGSGTTDRRFLHADERGSIVAVSNSSGTVTNVNTYDEYGKPGSGNVGRFQYTGQKWIAELGLYDYKARMYHPSLGRFMQADPIGYGDGMNIYAGMGGDPVNGTDPTGTSVFSDNREQPRDNEEEWLPGKGVSLIAGGHSYDGMGSSDLVRMAGGLLETLAHEQLQNTAMKIIAFLEGESKSGKMRLDSGAEGQKSEQAAAKYWAERWEAIIAVLPSNKELLSAIVHKGDYFLTIPHIVTMESFKGSNIGFSTTLSASGFSASSITAFIHNHSNNEGFSDKDIGFAEQGFNYYYYERATGDLRLLEKGRARFASQGSSGISGCPGGVSKCLPGRR